MFNIPTSVFIGFLSIEQNYARIQLPVAPSLLAIIGTIFAFDTTERRLSFEVEANTIDLLSIIS